MECESRALALCRGLVRAAPGNGWMRETTIKGRFAENFLRPEPGSHGRPPLTFPQGRKGRDSVKASASG